MDYNKIDEKIQDFLKINNDDITDDLYNKLFVTFKNRYISPNEIFLLTFNDKINRNKLVTYMFKYKIKTTWLGIYVLSMYANWPEDGGKLNIYIPGKTYALVYEDLGIMSKNKTFMYGTFDNFIVMKRIFLPSKLVISKTDNPKFKNDHDNPIVHPKKNKKRGMFMSDGNCVRIYNGPIEDYWRADYLLYHKEGDIIEGVNDQFYDEEYYEE